MIAVFNANQGFRGVPVRILDGGHELFGETTDLTPEKAWRREVPAPQGPVTVEFGKLMRQTEGQYDWSPESEIHVGPQPWQVPLGPLETGTDDELNGRLLAAYDTYAKALESSPNDFELRVAAGRLAAGLLRYQDAVRWLEPAQAKATYDPEIAYYLGLAYAGLGRIREARGEFETAQRMPSFHVAGSRKLAELLASEGKLQPAAGFEDPPVDQDRTPSVC